MGRIIINNSAGIEDVDAIDKVMTVMKQGKISKGRFGEQYCHLTTFTPDIGHNEIRVWATKTETGTHSFDVYIDSRKIEEEQVWN